jgi:hypothetical protein
MVDRDFVLRWAHMGLGRRYPAIMDEQRRELQAHIAEIQVPQMVPATTGLVKGIP